MKIILGFFLFLFSINTLFAQVSFGEPEKINDEWRFQKGDFEKASNPDFNDSKWRELDLPHDWSVEGPISPNLASATGYLPGGIAWYRKTLEINADKIDKKVYVYFEGVYRNAEIFINGVSLGMRPNGYISFLYDLTPYLKFGEQNTIAVRVDHSESADSRWYTGSGIYREVYLIYANPVHINQWGVYCTTPEVSEKKASVEIETSVKNESETQANLTVLQEISDKNNNVIKKTSKKLIVPAGKTEVITQTLNIKKPNLWSLENPNLYQLTTSVYAGNELTDKSVENIGIRTFEFDTNNGFSLNGKSMKVKGVCLHHDAGCLGSAVPKEVWERRLTTLKELGCNAIRTSHNPQAPVFYEICDKIGMLVLNEAFDEWEYPKKKWLEGWNFGTPGFQGHADFFKEWGETDLSDMVKRDRNHSSVFMWSIGNEVDYPNDPYSHPILNQEGIQQQHTKGYLPNQPNAERLGAIAKQLTAVVKKYDNSRPVTAGLAGPVMSNETEYPAALDVVGYNYTERRYEQDHLTYPDRIFYGSENGHSMSAWKAVRDNDYIFGQFLWTGINYLGEAGRWPSRGSGSGLLNMAGFKKPRGFFRESLWSEKSMIYLGTYKNQNNSNRLSVDAPAVWNYKVGENIRVVCYTNCQKAQLLLNGEKIENAKKYNDESGIMYWDIPFQKGKLEVIGYNSEKEVSRYSIQTTKQPHSIKATLENKIILADKGVAQVEIQIIDVNGNPVFFADNEITCLIEGPAKLLGMEASNTKDISNYSDNKSRVFQGKMIVYTQATGEKGSAKITFSSPWLIDATVELSIQ